MQSEETQAAYFQSEETRKSIEELKEIASECRNIVSLFYAVGVNNLNMQIRKLYENASRVAKIMRRKSLWGEWLLIRRVNVNNIKLNLSTTITTFYAESENSMYKFMTILHSFGLEYREVIEDNQIHTMLSFCSEIKFAIDKIEHIQRKVQSLRMCIASGYAQ